jgi:phage I-like protein
MMEYQLDTTAIAPGDEYQMILPIGKFHTRKYGELEITPEFAADIARNWQAKVLGEREVFIDSQHQQDQSYGWVKDLQVRDDGIYAKVEWTELGQDAVSKGIYRYFSAAIGAHVDIKSGERLYPVLHTVSLTNTPVMYTMRPVHLSDNPAHGDGIETIEEESMKTLAEIKDALFALSEDERDGLSTDERVQIATALGIELADPKRIEELEEKLSVEHDKAEVLLSENTELSQSLTEYREAEKVAKRDKVLEHALSEGKILPKNRERWERLYDADPEGTESLLAEKAREIDYDKDGTSRAEEKHFSDDIVSLADLRGIKPEEAAELIASVTRQEE